MSNNPTLQRIALLSTHGYFDAVPVLGRTDTGGQVTYVLEIAKGMGKLGLNVDIITRRFENYPAIDPVNDNVRVIKIPCGPKEFVRKEDIYPYLDELSNNLLAWMQQNQISYDVLHSHYVDAGIVAMKTAQQLKLPFYHTAHSLGAWKRHLMGGDSAEMEKTYSFNLRIDWENKLIKAAKGIITTNPEELKIYKDFYQIVPKHTQMCPPGVDTQKYFPFVITEPCELPKPYVLCVSRIDANKGLDSILHAFALVKDRAPKLNLVIGGGSKTPGAVEQQVLNKLHEIVKSKELQNRVIFTGYIPDEKMPIYYRNATMFVLPSRFEPFGMTAQEAMASGTPVIVTSLGGLKHFLTDNENAILIDPLQYDKLADAIIRIYNDPQFAKRLAHGGLKIVHEHFTWDAMVRKHLEFYKSTL